MRYRKARQIAGSDDRDLMGNLFRRSGTRCFRATRSRCVRLHGRPRLHLCRICWRTSRPTPLRSSSFGVRAGDRVTVQLEKSIEGVWLYLAVLRGGAIYMPLNSGYTDAEMRVFRDRCGTDADRRGASRRDAVAALVTKGRCRRNASRRLRNWERRVARCAAVPSVSRTTATSPRSCTPRVPPGAPRAR